MSLIIDYASISGLITNSLHQPSLLILNHGTSQAFSGDTFCCLNLATGPDINTSRSLESRLDGLTFCISS